MDLLLCLRSGTSQMGECLARLLIDIVFVVIPFAPTFSLPLHGIGASHTSAGEFVSIYIGTAWAFTSLGYVCSLSFPGAPAVANVAFAFVLSTFLSGTMGFDPSSVVSNPGLTDQGYGIFTVIPGYWTLILQLWLTCTERPFDGSRTTILYKTQDFGMLPGKSYSDESVAEAAVYTYEVRSAAWYGSGLLSLWLFGLFVRFLSLLIFVVRNWDLQAVRRNMGACLRRQSATRAVATRSGSRY